MGVLEFLEKRLEKSEKKKKLKDLNAYGKHQAFRTNNPRVAKLRDKYKQSLTTAKDNYVKNAKQNFKSGSAVIKKGLSNYAKNYQEEAKRQKKKPKKKQPDFNIWG